MSSVVLVINAKVQALTRKPVIRVGDVVKMSIGLYLHRCRCPFFNHFGQMRLGNIEVNLKQTGHATCGCVISTKYMYPLEIIDVLLKHKNFSL